MYRSLVWGRCSAGELKLNKLGRGVHNTVSCIERVLKKRLNTKFGDSPIDKFKFRLETSERRFITV